MKRNLSLLATALLTLAAAGCGNESRDDVVSGVVTMMDNAAAEIKSVAKRVDEAAAKGQPLDLTEANKSIQNLEEIGSKYAQQRKREVEMVRSSITEEEKQALQERFAPKVRQSHADLLKARDDLKKALERAEAIDAEKTGELRDALRKAEAPFESLARQQ